MGLSTWWHVDEWSFDTEVKSCLEIADTSSPQTRALFSWIIFLGGAAVAGTRDRAWFVARLVKNVMEWKIGSWEVMKVESRGFWWVGRIHEGACKELWDEAMITMAVLFKL